MPFFRFEVAKCRVYAVSMPAEDLLLTISGLAWYTLFNKETRMAEIKQQPKYPSAIIQVAPKDSAMSILIAVRKAMKEAGASDEDLIQFAAVATVGSRDVLIAAGKSMVTIEVAE